MEGKDGIYEQLSSLVANDPDGIQKVVMFVAAFTLCWTVGVLIMIVGIDQKYNKGKLIDIFNAKSPMNNVIAGAAVIVLSFFVSGFFLG